ncbi:protein of unknown function DUF554 [Anaeromyxobacter sp. K]|uniref:DUF554 domain-containing protein n=1 Tax=Anaeromyxobacter sp. (strain K) TaxID=447217 RepID=UPI00015F9028|nr:DUF554 domain-containing protein [Anaeromyxobacter sp. K]ACG72775.1 protein of unknown function DUF554 [Anaeromyxobacter sp. K]
MLDLVARTSGTWSNVAAIAAGTLVGASVGARLPDRLGRTLMQVLGLVTLLVGLGMALGLDGVRAGPLPGIILALVSLALGAVVGELLGIEERLTSIGEAARRKVGGGGRFTEGFVTASLLFCIGPMAIVGSIQNGLTLDAQTLVLKSSLDGIAAVALAGVYGVGVGLSALPILVLQGGISVAAAALARVLPDPATDPRVLAVGGAGGLLVAGIGVNLLLAGMGMEDRRVRVGSMLPALVIAPVLVVVLAGW